MWKCATSYARFEYEIENGARTDTHTHTPSLMNTNCYDHHSVIIKRARFTGFRGGCVDTTTPAEATTEFAPYRDRTDHFTRSLRTHTLKHTHVNTLSLCTVCRFVRCGLTAFLQQRVLTVAGAVFVRPSMCVCASVCVSGLYGRLNAARNPLTCC